MNLLIVDDEIFAIRGILDSVDWGILKFDEVLTATCYSQAVNLMKQKEIAVLLCDIEMPVGSGLDLLEWVQNYSPETQCIILSCHDDFSYAQQAISLNCMEYLVKPAPPEQLTEVFARARKRYEENRESRRIYDYGKKHLGLTAENTVDTGEKKEDVVARTQQYIEEHIESPLSVEDLARRVYMNPEYLSRLFKKKFHKTLLEYIILQRMDLAASLLKNSDLTVSMISARIGYPNYSYFTKLFRKYYGMSPREYRERNKK